MFGKTLMHVFHISCRLTDFILLRNEIIIARRKFGMLETNFNNNKDEDDNDNNN